jgi:hypothetical protein
MNISCFEYDSKLYFNIKKLHCFLHQVVYFYYIILLFFFNNVFLDELMCKLMYDFIEFQMIHLYLFIEITS